MLFSVPFVLALVLAHGGSTTRPEGLTWMHWHMKEEHHMDDFDPKSFFKLHDLEGTGKWSKDDVLALYGLSRAEVVGDGSGMGEHDHDKEEITQETKDNVVTQVLRLIDENNDGLVGLNEWLEFAKSGGELPDFGYGPGHHLDFEAEYEEHHWNKYHKDQDPNVLVKHKEDIEHEILHHEHEMDELHGQNPDAHKASKFFQSHVRLQNVPAKYKRS